MAIELLEEIPPLTKRERVRASKRKWNAKNVERNRLAARARRAKNRDRIRATKRAWAAKNREKVRASGLAWRKKNLETHRARARAWGAKNKERMRERYKKWIAKNKERDNARRRANYTSNPEKKNAWNRAWAKRNPDRAREVSRQSTLKRRAGGTGEVVLISELLRRHKGRCWICRKPVDPNGDRRKRPTIDHFVPLSRGGKHEKSNCRLACFGCNCSKGADLPLVALMRMYAER